METAVPKQNSLRLRLSYYLTPSLLVTADFLAICLAVYIALLLRNFILGIFSLETGALVVSEAYLYLTLPIFYVSIIASTGLYERRQPLYQWAQNFFKITSYICTASIIAAYMLGKAETISRLFIALFWCSSFLSFNAMRCAMKRLLHAIGVWQRPVIIVGAGKTAELLERSFQRDSGSSYEIIGFIEDDKSRPLFQSTVQGGY